MSESTKGSGWATAAKVGLGLAAALGLGWLFVKVAKVGAVVGAVAGAVFTAGALPARQQAGVVVQFPETPPPTGAGVSLTTEAGDALALRALCDDGKGGALAWSHSERDGGGKGTRFSVQKDVACPFDAAALAKVKGLGFTFWGPAKPV